MILPEAAPMTSKLKPLVLLVLLTFTICPAANAYVILPSECRGEKEDDCLKQQRLEYIFIYGSIGFEEKWFFRDLDEVWPNDVPLPLIYLESYGGDAETAMEIGRILHRRKATVATGNPITETEGYTCYSACGTLASGATQRYLNNIGFHQAHRTKNYCKFYETREPVEAEFEEKLDTYLDEVGADPRVKSYRKDTPFYEIKEFSFDQQIDYRSQMIAELGFHMDVTSPKLKKTFRDDPIKFIDRRMSDVFEFAIAEGSKSAVTDYAEYELCEANDHNPNYQKAEKILRTSMFDNDLYGIHQLGEIYASGKIDGKTAADAVSMFRIGAAAGYGPSENMFGWAFYRGEGLNQNYRQAVYWFKKAASHNHHDAYGSLCIVYMEAKAVKANDIERYKWCHLAKENVEDRKLKEFAHSALEKLKKRMKKIHIEFAKKS